MDADHLDPGQLETEGPVLVSTVIAKDSWKRQRDKTVLAHEATVDPAANSQRTGPDTLGLIESGQTFVGALRLSTDSQTLVPIEDKDLFTGSLRRAIENWFLITERHPFHDTVTQPTGSPDGAQEEDKKPSMSSQQRAPDSQVLDMGNRPQDLGQGDTGDPVRVMPTTAKDNQKLQVHNPRSPTEHLRLVPGHNVGPDMASQQTALGTQGLVTERQPPRGSLTLPTDVQNPHLEGDQDPATRRQETALDMTAPMRVRLPVGKSLSLPKDGTDSALERHKDPTMSRRETAQDMQGHNTTKVPPRDGRTLPVVSHVLTVQVGTDRARNNQETPQGIQGRIMDRQPTKGSLTLPMDGQYPTLGKDKTTTVTSQEIPPDTQGLDVDKTHLDPLTAEAREPLGTGPVIVKESQNFQTISQPQGIDSLGPAQQTNCGVIFHPVKHGVIFHPSSQEQLAIPSSFAYNVVVSVTPLKSSPLMDHDNLVQIRHQQEKWMQYSEQFLEENIQPDNVELESC
ncbi:hypothetical protein MUG91_G166n2 [Manis pentadactyla]|nr:hypothetical protein MUG91_G166n2 [Manis pentadactyla]